MALWTRRTSTCGRPVSQVIGALGLAEGLLLDAVDQLDELRVVDRDPGLLALLRERRREALDQLAGDADHHLRRPEPGHLLGFLERHRAVVDDRGDVRDRARLHVRQALALAAHAADGALAPRRRSRTRAPWRTRCRCRAPCTRPGRAPRRGSRSGAGTPSRPPRPGDRRGASRRAGAIGDGGPNGRDRVPQPLAARALALGHLRASAASAVDHAPRRPGRARPPRSRARRGRR